VALQATTGNILWDREYAPSKQGYFSTVAPLVTQNLVIVGVGGGGSGRRAFVSALDAATGEERWRFWTVPSKDQPEAKTWAQFPLDWGGAPTWTTGSYDPELNLVYWPTGNPWPDFYGGDRPGDNLYSDCVVALDATTGKLRWYFQFTPHDTHDWDANETPVLLNQEFGGRVRKLLVQANRNGFFYVLDRTDGKFLRVAPFVEKLNWATGIDASGRPLVSGKVPTKEGTYICPGINGATNWFSPSYNPNTSLFYVMALENCNVYFVKPKPFTQGETFYGTGTKLPADEHSQKVLLALSPADGKQVWRYAQIGHGESWGGTLTTAGGLVFFGDDAGAFEAVDAETGRALWHFNTGQPFYASPMTYSMNGIQYVAICAGSDLFSFAPPH